ncbi:thiamine phosphate synthase [Microcella sp.]|uniref:thiamine phosphate synthase n=1 Tax=Microcella sp. TaxID=1913979 RepID=UPI00391C7778
MNHRYNLSLHLVTDESLTGHALAQVVDAAIRGGVTVVQLRAKGASARELTHRAVMLSGVIDDRAAFVIDDRADVVLAARDRGATVDGVHLGQSDLPVETARRMLGDGSLIGLTANTLDHLDAAAEHGAADYLGVGVIRPTATKPDHPAPLGVNGFARLARRTALPCVAIGGVTPADVGPLRAAGAAGVAVVSAICAADDPQAAARSFVAGAAS